MNPNDQAFGPSPFGRGRREAKSLVAGHRRPYALGAPQVRTNTGCAMAFRGRGKATTNRAQWTGVSIPRRATKRRDHARARGLASGWLLQEAVVAAEQRPSLSGTALADWRWCSSAAPRLLSVLKRRRLPRNSPSTARPTRMPPPPAAGLDEVAQPRRH